MIAVNPSHSRMIHQSLPVTLHILPFFFEINHPDTWVFPHIWAWQRLWRVPFREGRTHGPSPKASNNWVMSEDFLRSVEQLVDFYRQNGDLFHCDYGLTAIFCPLKWWFISLRLVQYGFKWIYVTFLLSSKHGLVTSGGLMTIMTYCGLRISRNLANLPSNMGIYNGFNHQKMAIPPSWLGLNH